MKKPKILLLSDDITSTSGIGTMSREFVFWSSDKVDWVQLGSAVNHPDVGKVIDLSTIVNNATGYDNASVIVHPYSGYGDPIALRKLIEEYKPDAILHFTDPRYWQWLYQMEYEIHTKYQIPIMYYAIWDNLPYPYWNKGSYSACDLIMSISKQSKLIHDVVLESGGVKTRDLNSNYKNHEAGDVIVTYVPHGVNDDIYYPIDSKSKFYDEYVKFSTPLREKYDFIVLWVNRNIRRKQPADVIHSFKIFCDKIGKDLSKRTLLIMHTNPIDENGTDLNACREIIAKDCNIIFSTSKLGHEQMNFQYNVADVTLNIGSNEGFGLSSLESIMAGTMVINNVTGGLQDQMGFKDHDGNLYFPNREVPSNHIGTYKQCGEWAIPVYPSNRSIQGSVQTPYIFDDRCDASDVAKALQKVYLLERKTRKSRGLKGREWARSEEVGMTSKLMCKGMYESMMKCIENFKTSKFSLKRIAPHTNKLESGIIDK